MHTAPAPQKITKWHFTASVDGANIDFETILESEEEPGFWVCQNLAEDHGCELWSLGPIIEA